MKRLVGIVCLGLAAVALTAASAQPFGVDVAVVGDPDGTEQFQAAPGETVELAVRASDAGAVAGIQFDVVFDEEMAHALQDVAVADDLPTSLKLEHQVEPGMVHVVLVGNEAIGRDTVTLIHFQIVVDGESGETAEFTIANTVASDVDGQPLQVTTTPGVLTIGEAGTVTPAMSPTPSGTRTPTATPTVGTPSTVTPTGDAGGDGGCTRGMVAASSSLLRGEGALFASLLGLVALRKRWRK